MIGEAIGLCVGGTAALTAMFPSAKLLKLVVNGLVWRGGYADCESCDATRRQTVVWFTRESALRDGKHSRGRS